MTTGQFIRETRLKKGMTQEELATKTDISVRSIQRIENGDVNPRSEEFLKYGKDEPTTEQSRKNNNWLALLHVSGLFILLIPPIIIWIWQKDKVPNIREHAIDVVNFQLSMLIYLIPSSILAMVLLGLPIVIFLGVFSTTIIIINTIKVINHQPYKYPITIKILKP
ncbi:MAG: helix-turn-helix domain-containing protein [Bacteroidales bacterium]|jgi:uncharacterized Tic20 family protein/DNA-binding XRE family transcriptional regulator|nr:helix-turn-helix domain-containing protein [Clostridia bacterium]